MKKILAFILSAVFIMAMAVPAFAAGNKIVKAEATFVYPKAGDKVEFKSLTVGNPDEYTAEIESIYYFDKDSNVVHVKNADEYTEGIMYRVRIRFTEKTGYHIDSNCEFWINGEKQVGSVGTNLAEIAFIAAKNGSLNPATGEPLNPGEGEEPAEELNIFQKIIAFFKNLFETIRNFFTSLLPKE
jgi:hypothetical protein